MRYVLRSEFDHRNNKYKVRFHVDSAKELMTYRDHLGRYKLRIIDAKDELDAFMQALKLEEELNNDQ